MRGANNPNFGKKRKHHGKRHWYKCPNGETVSMRSTWEAAYAEHLDGLGTMWKYEPETFVLADGRAYTPDFHITGTNKWVEVKGWLTVEHKERMKLWKAGHPDKKLILADRKYLELLGINLKKKWITSKPKFKCLECKELFYRKYPDQRLCSVTCRNTFISKGGKLQKKDGPKRKYNGNQRGENNSSSKLKLEDVKEIRELRKSGVPVKKISEIKETSASNVYNICKGVSWTLN